MHKRILLPLDGSELAEKALPHALAQAEHFEAELILLMVSVQPSEPPGMWSLAVKQARDRARASAREYLEQAAVRVKERGVPVKTVTLEGRPHVEITRFAEDNQVDLIVMCARGQSGLSRWLMGSVADRVVRGSTTPVLLVPATAAK